MLAMGILVLLAKIPLNHGCTGSAGSGSLKGSIGTILSTAATACVRKLFNVISTNYTLSCVSSC
ncbi:hypothetical protein HDV62DRAFT_347482 [Trichoderma sp. SZMC 28011]